MNCKFTYLSLVLSVLMTWKGTLLKATPFSNISSTAATVTGGSTPIFIANVGQIKDQYGQDREDIDFKISVPGFSLFIGKGKLHYQWLKQEIAPKQAVLPFSLNPASSSTIESYRMDVELIGANISATKIVEGKGSFYENHFNVSDAPSGVRAYSYKKITYKNIYPNIDWVLYTKGNHVEYDFVVHPGARPEDIRIKYSGATSLNLNENGSITAQTPLGSLTEKAPYSFQEDGKKVASQFKLENNTLSFQIEKYKGTLTIDPVLVWSSYYGGEAMIIEGVSRNTTDRIGNVYYAGNTSSTINIATIGAYRNTLTGAAYNTWLSKFNSAGKRQWATYYSSNGAVSTGVGIACDTLGHIYISSETDSLSDIVTPGAHQLYYGGGETDLYLAKFDTSGNRIWSTYFGGEDMELSLQEGSGLVSDGRMIYMAGVTRSYSGIAKGGHQLYYGGWQDALLAKFDENGTLKWSTYYGGYRDESWANVAIDKNGSIYLSGMTASPNDMATPGSFQATFSGERDCFLAKFNPAGTLMWGTYFGGDKIDMTTGIICDMDNNIYLCGSTNSETGVATMGSYQTRYGGGTFDAYIAKFNTEGEREWATYYGGESEDRGSAIAIDSWGRIFMSGTTFSDSGITSNNAYQTQYGGTLLSMWGDGFFAEFNTMGKKKWSSYYGSTGDDFIYDIHADNLGSLYICGITASQDLATPGSHMDSFHIWSPLTFTQGFMSRFCLETPSEAMTISGADTVCAFKTEEYRTNLFTDAEAYIWKLPDNWEGTSDNNRITVTVGSGSGVIKFQVKRCGYLSEWVEYPVYILPSDPASVTISGFTLGTTVEYASYQWLLNGEVLPGATQREHTVTKNGSYSVITITEDGCMDTSDLYEVQNVSVGNLYSEENIRIFPNPGSGSVLYISALVPVSVSLYGVDGRLLKYQAEGRMLNIEDITPGVYLIRISDWEGRILKTEKWLKW